MADCLKTEELNNSYPFITTFIEMLSWHFRPFILTTTPDLKNLPGMMNPDEGSA